MTIFFAIILYIAGFYLLARRTVAGAVAPRNRITFLAVLFLVYSCIAAGFAILAYQWRNPGLAMFFADRDRNDIFDAFPLQP